VLPVMLPRWAPLGVGSVIEPLVAKYDTSLTEGIDSIPYAMPYVRVEGLVSDPGIPVGVWRSVGNSQNAFFTESFVDELAHELGEDPVRFRLERLPADSRVRGALELLVARGGWGSAPEGVYQGIAVHESFGTVVAEQVDVALENGAPVVRRVVCAVDCGVVVNPDVVRMQLESAVVFALSAALHGEITIRDGAVVQGNFDDYPLVRIDACPEIEVYLVASERPPSGIGEPGVPPLAPALANAIFAATGKRLRELPLRVS
jgi:CO/xanthine dehydrogenase Mo-binding subunit